LLFANPESTAFPGQLSIRNSKSGN